MPLIRKTVTVLKEEKCRGVLQYIITYKIYIYIYIYIMEKRKGKKLQIKVLWGRSSEELIIHKKSVRNEFSYFDNQLYGITQSTMRNYRMSFFVRCGCRVCQNITLLVSVNFHTDSISLLATTREQRWRWGNFTSWMRLKNQFWNV